MTSRDTEIERLDNEIRELRGAEPGELARCLIERGWRSQPASEPTTWAAPTSAPSLDVAVLEATIIEMDEAAAKSLVDWRDLSAGEIAAELAQRLSQPADNEAAE